MSSTATPMWSILPNIGGSLRRRRGLALAGLRAPDAKDLGQRGDTDLELLRRRVLGRQVPLDLAARRMERLRQRSAVIAVAPGEHLYRDRGDAEADRGTRQRARP